MSVATGLASCDPTVNDLDRLVEDVLPCRTGVANTFAGDNASGGGAVLPPRGLTGDAAADVAALCRLGGTFGTSKAEFGCREEDDWYDRLDELLDAFLRPSGCTCPAAVKETNKGDDGCEGCDTCEILLGDALARVKPDGDCGRAFALDSVLWIWVDTTGLPSSDGAGDGTPPSPPSPPGLTDDCLLWTARASALSFWITSLFAFSNTGRFLKEKLPKSSAAIGSLNLRDLRSRT